MELLRNLFGNVTSGIIRLAVIVGAIAAVGIFIVKPVLDKTDDVIRSSGFNQLDKSLEGVDRTVQHEVEHSYRLARRHGQKPQKLVLCVEHSKSVVQIERCARHH
jgi:hypothetical protein